MQLKPVVHIYFYRFFRRILHHAFRRLLIFIHRESHPILVKGHIPFQDSVGHDAQHRKRMGFPAIAPRRPQPVGRMEDFPAHNRLVMVALAILRPIISVLFGFVRQEIWREGLSRQNVSAMPLIGNDSGQGRRAPFCVAHLCPAPIIGQKFGDFLERIAIQIEIENHLNRFRLFRVDYQVSVLIPIVSQKLWGKKQTPLESAIHRPVHDDRLGV